MEPSFSFRWGVDMFDNERTPVPNWILANYHRVKWEGQDEHGQPISGLGISNTEMMFILHLASFRYETENGQASPSLTGTLAERMNYKTNQGIIKVEQGLIEKGLLIVEKRIGKTSVYNFTPFSQAVLAVMNDQSTKVDESAASGDDPSTKVDDHSSTKVDDTRLQKLTRRKRNKKENPKEREDHDSLSAEKNGRSPPDYQALWQAALSELSLGLTKPTFKSHLAYTRAVERENGRLVVACPNTFSRDWLELRLRPKIEAVLADLGVERVEFVVEDG